MKVRSAVVVSVILGLANCVYAADNLRVATFNINWGNVDLPDIQRAMTAADADVICIQESTRASERFLLKHFRGSFPHIVFKGHRGKFLAERFGFMSKTPLIDVQYSPPVDGLFGTYVASVKHDNRAIRVINVHLSPFVVPQGAGFRGALQAMSKVEAVHEKEIAAVSSNIDADHPTLVCGDFNSLSTFAAPKQLATLGLTDSFAAVTMKPDSQPTWRWPVGKLNLQLRIDYIFHTNHFTTVSSRIVPTKGSDHYLVVTELAFKPATRKSATKAR